MSLEVMFGLGTGMAAHACNNRKKVSSVFAVQMDTVHVQSRGGRPRRGQTGKIEQRRKALHPVERKNRDKGRGLRDELLLEQRHQKGRARGTVGTT